jgi:hypothetical protein
LKKLVDFLDWLLPCRRKEVVMQQFYFMPVLSFNGRRRPAYFRTPPNIGPAAAVWELGEVYDVGAEVGHNNIGSNGSGEYRCIQAHVSSADNEPNAGTSWTSYWDVYLVAPNGVRFMDYGRAGLQNVMLCYFYGDISQAEHDFLAAQSDVYAISPADLDSAIQGVQEARDFFEAMQIPAQWLTPSNTYRELLRQLAGVFQFSQRYHGRAGEALLSSVGLDTKYKDFPLEVQGWFDWTVSSFGIDPAIIKPNSTLRQMMKSAGDYLANMPFQDGGWDF